MPKLKIVIGANGAGKTTWSRANRETLPARFYNQDLLAEGLGGWNDAERQREARSIVDQRFRAHLHRMEDFGFESTYSGKSRPGIVKATASVGYEVEAVFIGTILPEINIARIAKRADERTGHRIADDIVKARWSECPTKLVETAWAIATATIIDNSFEALEATNPHRFEKIAVVENGGSVQRYVVEPPVWAEELIERIVATQKDPPPRMEPKPPDQNAD